MRPQVRSDDIKSVVAKRMQASKANKVMASIMPEFATFQARVKFFSSCPFLFSSCPFLFSSCPFLFSSCPLFLRVLTVASPQAPTSWVFKGE
jgi:hypothetical protein